MELIEKFVKLHSETEQLLAENKVKEARQKYFETIDAFKAIDQSSLERFHKELAHDQITALFSKVNNAKERIDIPYHIIVAVVFVMVFGFLIFIKPSIVGLAGLEEEVTQQVNLTFAETGLQKATLKERPLTLAASGNYTGNVELYYKDGEKFELLFKGEGGGSFENQCAETCELTASSNIVELFANIENGSLFVKELKYRIERKSNTAPVWDSKTYSFKAETGKTATIDLSEYYKDPDKDQLVFLSTSDEGLDVTVQNSKVMLEPKTKGTKKIVFIASDLVEVTRTPVIVEVS